MKKSFVLILTVCSLFSSVLVAQEKKAASKIELIVHEAEFPHSRIDPRIATLNGDNVCFYRFSPGIYELRIDKPGFIPLTEKVVIVSGDGPFVLKRRLKAKLRNIEDKITFDVIPSASLKPHRITISSHDDPQNERVVTKGDKIKPGLYNLKIEKEGYFNIEYQTYISPSENPLVIAEKMIALKPLTELKSDVFTYYKEGMFIDGIYYPLEMYADEEKIERHLIQREVRSGKLYFTIQVNSETEHLNIFAGYRYIQKPFPLIKAVSRLSNIDVPRLIEHLNQVAKKDKHGYGASIQVLKKLLRSFTQKRELRKASANELKKLAKNVESWYFYRNKGENRQLRRDLAEMIYKLAQQASERN